MTMTAENRADAPGILAGEAAQMDRSDLAEFLAEQDWSDFAQSLAGQFEQRGTLSARQWAAAESMWVKAELKAIDREAAGEVAPGVALDASRLFEGAEADRIRVRVADRDYHLSRPTRGQWVGWVFIRDDASGERLGTQRPGQYVRGADDTTTEALRWAIANRTEAVAMFGHATGHCGICGRELTHPESVERGIGPVCWGRIGG